MNRFTLRDVPEGFAFAAWAEIFVLVLYRNRGDNIEVYNIRDKRDVIKDLRMWKLNGQPN